MFGLFKRTIEIKENEKTDEIDIEVVFDGIQVGADLKVIHPLEKTIEIHRSLENLIKIIQKARDYKFINQVDHISNEKLEEFLKR